LVLDAAQTAAWSNTAARRVHVDGGNRRPEGRAADDLPRVLRSSHDTMLSTRVDGVCHALASTARPPDHRHVTAAALPAGTILSARLARTAGDNGPLALPYPAAAVVGRQQGRCVLARLATTAQRF
jgi:hypothetical protein